MTTLTTLTMTTTTSTTKTTRMTAMKIALAATEGGEVKRRAVIIRVYCSGLSGGEKY